MSLTAEIFAKQNGILDRHAKRLFLSGNLILAKRIPDNFLGRFSKLRAIRVKIRVHENIDIDNLFNLFFQFRNQLLTKSLKIFDF